MVVVKGEDEAWGESRNLSVCRRTPMEPIEKGDGQVRQS